jgi:acyl dehydratase
LLGGLLCALFLLWAEQVGVISSAEIREKAERAIAERDVGRLQEVNVDVARIHTNDEALRIPGVPESLTRLVSGYGVGAAGLILMVSALVAGSRFALFAIPTATIAWIGPELGIPAIGPLPAQAVSAAIGAGLLVVGMLWEGRR